MFLMIKNPFVFHKYTKTYFRIIAKIAMKTNNFSQNSIQSKIVSFHFNFCCSHSGADFL